MSARSVSAARLGATHVKEDKMADHNQGDGAQGSNHSNESDEVEKTKTLADRAGGGTNKGSDLGSNEDIDQAGGQDRGGQDD